ncbi:VOC family protein [Pseudolysinimonas sp.]|uniref:VOC family protein n=1 Tax=Pseudolysinimonas sp. TaxID=2680009 RepID=UPI003F802A82
MSTYVNAFEMSPVPVPGPDAVAPEPFHGIYGMPSFVTIPTADMSASLAFWTDALGFFDLFSVPGRLVHLRRWAFQDVLLVPADRASESVPAMTVSFACVLDQIDPLVAACRAIDASSVDEPVDTAWNTRDVHVVTPERVRVVFTAAKALDPSSEAARNLAAIGITSSDPEKNGERDR